MASLQSDIFLTVLQGKDYASCMAISFITKENNGESVDKCCYMKLMVLVRRIQLLESYYCNNFTAQGNVTSPNFVCLTQAQIQVLLGTVKSFIGV